MRRRTKLIVALAIAGLISFVTLCYSKRHGVAGLGYESLIAATAADYDLAAHILLFLGAPASPYEEMDEYSIYNSELFNPPLHYAVQQGDIDLAKKLLERGARVNWCCCSCETALHLAIQNKDVEMAKLLLRFGADTYQIYDMRLPALELAHQDSTVEMQNLIQVHNNSLASDEKP